MSMKKILVRCSDERRREFCVITTVVEDRETGEKQVWKDPVWPEAAAHLRNMVLRRDRLQAAYPRLKYCPVRQDGDRVVFDFVQGESLFDRYAKAYARGDREAFAALLRLHRELLTADPSNRAPFEPSPDFEEWYGDPAPYVGQAGLRLSNVDVTAGNVFFDGDDVWCIDYEWVMDFSVPEELAVWSCIQNTWDHLPGLEDFFPRSEAAKAAGLQTDAAELAKSWLHFSLRVITEPDGSSFAVTKDRTLKRLTPQDELKAEAARAWTAVGQITAERDDWKNRFHLVYDSRAYRLYRKVKKLLHIPSI